MRVKERWRSAWRIGMIWTGVDVEVERNDISVSWLVISHRDVSSRYAAKWWHVDVVAWMDLILYYHRYAPSPRYRRAATPCHCGAACPHYAARTAAHAWRTRFLATFCLPRLPCHATACHTRRTYLYHMHCACTFTPHRGRCLRRAYTLLRTPHVCHRAALRALAHAPHAQPRTLPLLRKQCSRTFSTYGRSAVLSTMVDDGS